MHIRDIAQLTGITVRTLRYYDSIGLLNPASKTEGGHRLYTEEDLKRLQQIQFLKSMGYPLKEIQSMLTDPLWNWERGLKNQLAYILEEQQRLKSMEVSIREFINGLMIERGDEQEAIQKLIQLTKQDKTKLQSYKESLLSGDEIVLWDKLPAMKGSDPDSLEWIALIGQLQGCIHEDPSCKKVQNIIRRMLEKQQEQFHGQDAFLDKLWEARKSPEESHRLGLYPLEPEVLEYMEKAYSAYMIAQTSEPPGSSKDQEGGHENQ
ncbi:MerR family transcriptional regulator [Paenibacillus lemnae]|uniref:MerR family transcriptional regulator n=1 Tax=Paenibacillus lemnae TaxID=1330551 RepID=A0A848M904_PAELE|nr:MerR family transcriptional regulator [Paenibacillus lemnae]